MERFLTSNLMVQREQYTEPFALANPDKSKLSSKMPCEPAKPWQKTTFGSGTHYVFLRSPSGGDAFPLDAAFPMGSVVAHGGTMAYKRIRAQIQTGNPMVMLYNSGGVTQAFASLHRAMLSDKAGGTEGGMTTGEVLRVRAAMKPIATVPHALRTVDVATGEEAAAHHQRSDVCAVPAAGVVAEAMVALVLANAMLEKFGGDSIGETRRNLDAYLAAIPDSLRTASVTVTE